MYNKFDSDCLIDNFRNEQESYFMHLKIFIYLL